LEGAGEARPLALVVAVVVRVAALFCDVLRTRDLVDAGVVVLEPWSHADLAAVERA
jgi:hypothetical protein